jgi:hypothetical protein
MVVEQDIDYLLQRYLEGQLDKKLITEEHYLYLEKAGFVKMRPEIWEQAITIRRNNLCGTNQASELRLLQDYLNKNETDLVKSDIPRVRKLARRIAVLQYFENKHNDHLAEV